MSEPLDEPAPATEPVAAYEPPPAPLVPVAEYPVPEYGAPVVAASTTAVRSDPLRGILAGVGAAVVGALAWTLFGYVTGIEVGLVATVLGLFVGYAVHKVGGTATTGTAAAAAVIAVVGAVIGFLLLDIALFAKQEGISFWDAYTFIGTTLGWPEAVKTSLGVAMRWLFLGLAGLGAFRIVAQRAVAGGGGRRR